MRLFSVTITLLVCIISGCSKTYVYHTKATSAIKGDSTEYVFENDTVKITYDFWAMKGKMSFSIYNKLNAPIYIDWKNSALISDDIKFAYWVEKETRNSKSSGAAWGGNHAAYGTSSERSIAVKEERVSSIPPHSLIRKTPVERLHDTFTPKEKGKKRDMRFRNFIAYSTNEDVKNDSYIDNGFDVVKVEKMKHKIIPCKRNFFVY
jgi:hypothetical protein